MTDLRPWNWAERRAIVLDRADHECAECGGLATEADHIWPKRHGGTDEFDNLQALCRSCNAAKGDQLYIDNMTPSRLAATVDSYITDALVQLRNASRYIALAWALVDDLSPAEANATVPTAVVDLDPLWRRYVVDQVATGLHLDAPYDVQPASHVRFVAPEPSVADGISPIAAAMRVAFEGGFSFATSSEVKS